MKKKLYGKYYWYQEKPWWKKVNVNKSLNHTVCGVFMEQLFSKSQTVTGSHKHTVSVCFK